MNWMNDGLLLHVKGAERRGQIVYLMGLEAENVGWIPWPHG